MILLTCPQMELVPQADLAGRLKIAEANSKILPVMPLQGNETVFEPDCEKEACATHADSPDTTNSKIKRGLMDNKGLFTLFQAFSAPSQKLIV